MFYVFFRNQFFISQIIVYKKEINYLRNFFSLSMNNLLLFLFIFNKILATCGQQAESTCGQQDASTCGQQDASTDEQQAESAGRQENTSESDSQPNEPKGNNQRRQEILKMYRKWKAMKNS